MLNYHSTCSFFGEPITIASQSGITAIANQVFFVYSFWQSVLLCGFSQVIKDK